MTRARALMILGTGSGAGKSLIAAGFCRVFSDAGLRTAPFKAQNMSNNSFVTAEGGEIGRAQAVQAFCARMEPSVDMNPVLLKPSADNCSQVVLQGKAIGNFAAREYYAGRERLWTAIRESYERLASSSEVVVLEGAGSPAEVNLRDRDMVNMAMAEYADARCLLVADIDRGGVFASVVGTLELLEPRERDRIDGILINKFRGDISLLEDGLRFLERKTGKKVAGVLPFDRSLWIEEEDALTVEGGGTDPEALDIAVVLLPHLSNFTDSEILKQEPGVRLRYVRAAADLGRPDLLILPGTKATIADLLDLKRRGLDVRIREYAAAGGAVFGICGGYQMLGRDIFDPEALESGAREATGLGLLNMSTEFRPGKILCRSMISILAPLFGRVVEGTVEGYEIHMGRTSHHELYAGFGPEGAVHPSGRVAGTYFHGLFDQPGFRRSFLEALAGLVGKKIAVFQPLSTRELRDLHYNRLADLLRANVDMEFVRRSLNLSQPAFSAHT